MGNCCSCDAISSASATAKVIFPDGHLQEYAGGHVRVSQVLSNSKEVLTSPCFVCNADDLEFDGYVSAIAGDGWLRPGQMYFVLPTSVLRRRLQPEEMAALAVRASAALVRSGASVVHVGEVEDLALEMEERSERSEKRRRRRRTTTTTMSGRRGRDFTSELGAIAE